MKKIMVWDSGYAPFQSDRSWLMVIPRSILRVNFCLIVFFDSSHAISSTVTLWRKLNFNVVIHNTLL